MSLRTFVDGCISEPSKGRTEHLGLMNEARCLQIGGQPVKPEPRPNCQGVTEGTCGQVGPVSIEMRQRADT